MTERRPVGRRAWLAGVLGLSAAGCREGAPAVQVAGVASLFVGGDVHLGQARRAPIFEPELAQRLAGRQGVVNLEGPIGPAPAEVAGALRLANAPEALSSLREASIAVAGVANNHALDRGELGVSETREALAAASLTACGLGPAATLDAGGLRVAITAHDLASGPPRAGELARARAGADLLLATFHVTGPPSYVPRPELREAVDLALAEGASVVAAHGTHALGPVERRGEAVIAWGLGNLVFSCDCTEEIDGALLLLELERERSRARIVPIRAGLAGAPASPSQSAPLLLDLLEAIGSTRLERQGDSATF